MMSLHQTLRHLRQHLTPLGSTQSPMKWRARPEVEILEDRVVPSLAFPAQYGAQGTSNGHDVLTGDIPVYLIFAGGASSGFGYDGSLDENAIVTAVNHILNSPYLSGLSEYGAATHAHVAGTFVSHYNLPKQFNDDGNNGDINNLVSDSIHDNNGNSPFPEPDDTNPTGVYMVFTPQGYSLGGNALGHHTNGHTGSLFDADSADDGVVTSSQVSVPEPAPTANQPRSQINFGGLSALDSMSVIFSHELAEIITDPANGGVSVTVTNSFSQNYSDLVQSPGEIGDNEAELYVGYVNGTRVQAYWSKNGGDYIIPGGTAQKLARRPAVINYAGGAENVFMAGADGNLYVDHYDPSSGWSWGNLSNPGVRLTSDPAVINYDGGIENVFVVGADGNLYVDHYYPSSGWSWVNQGNPGVRFVNDPAVVNYDGGIENVYIVGADGNLYVNHFDPSSGWSWVNQGNPGARFTGDPAVINYAAGSENVFIAGADGNLYVNHYDPGSGWGWANQGNPGFFLVSNPAVINYDGGVENVFIAAADGNLYVDHYDPNSGWSWGNQGSPGAPFAGNAAAVNYDGGIENVFVAGVDGNLYVNHFDPSGGWVWANQGNPGIPFASDPAVINYGGGDENVFIAGVDRNLYADNYDPSSGWGWVDLNKPGPGFRTRPANRNGGELVAGAGENLSSPLDIASSPPSRKAASPGRAPVMSSETDDAKDVFFAMYARGRGSPEPLGWLNDANLPRLAERG